MSGRNTVVTVGADRQGCARILGAALDRVADKWAIMAVGALSDGPKRFNALVREIDGVSQRMLTLTLRNLEKDGLITRTVYPTSPPRVDYALTPLGETLIEPLTVLFEWARDHLSEMEKCRQTYQEREDLERVG